MFYDISLVFMNFLKPKSFIEKFKHIYIFKVMDYNMIWGKTCLVDILQYASSSLSLFLPLSISFSFAFVLSVSSSLHV